MIPWKNTREIEQKRETIGKNSEKKNWSIISTYLSWKISGVHTVTIVFGNKDRWLEGLNSLADSAVYSKSTLKGSIRTHSTYNGE
jgi:hypothetical protein